MAWVPIITTVIPKSHVEKTLLQPTSVNTIGGEQLTVAAELYARSSCFTFHVAGYLSMYVVSCLDLVSFFNHMPITTSILEN
jgi:hypothetical protein